MVVPFTTRRQGMCTCVCIERKEKREKKRGGRKGVGRTEMGKIIINTFYFVCLVNTVLNRLPLEALVGHLSTNINRARI